ncbi:hypothetical protein B0H17DRAFT_1338695 [Mycena rosella]|uniref:BTB domain-containing protein n=1 Tax=Mycena rosella TaxID=1033263 RepID=A0AAD7CHT3_MYCRO|nr:hypothetical protein B0H17DRAFT_1338695 [Mycena rosella]
MSLQEATHALSLQEATRNSTSAWQRDLAALFQHAKERFPDVVWELTTEGQGTEEVWGHKAIVYARAPPSFQTRYFSFRPQGRGGSPLAASALSLDIPRGSRSPSPSPFRTASPAPSTTVGGLTRLTTSINPALFSNELEYLYTGQGFGEAFEFLFDEQAGEEGPGDGDDAGPEELRIDKLRKDLVFMWRSRLYSDVRIALTSNGPPVSTGDDDDAHDRQMPVFSSHRFILASRSPYFHTALISWPSPSKPLSSSLSGSSADPLTLSLPSPPFTPASLHFTLGFLYTGTLIFSHRTYDLSTALALLLSATYLSLPTLHAEVRARIISEMAHGLFHAALPFAAYESLTQGAWRAGGCTCRKCAQRVPRILEFALRPDAQDEVLERGARRALVGLFGAGWCTPEFAALPPKLHASALKGLAKRSTPANALAILWAAEHAKARLAPLVDAWADVVRPLIDAGRSGVDAVLGGQTAAVLGEKDWAAIMSSDGVRFEDGERVEWVMRGVVRGANETNAGRVYQALVNVLLLPHPDPAEEGTFPAQPLLSQTSHVRVQVEQARIDVLNWLKRGGRGRADRLAREGGLDGVEGWAVREIGDCVFGVSSVCGGGGRRRPALSRRHLLEGCVVAPRHAGLWGPGFADTSELAVGVFAILRRLHPSRPVGVHLAPLRWTMDRYPVAGSRRPRRAFAIILPSFWGVCFAFLWVGQAEEEALCIRLETSFPFFGSTAPAHYWGMLVSAIHGDIRVGVFIPRPRPELDIGPHRCLDATFLYLISSSDVHLAPLRRTFASHDRVLVLVLLPNDLFVAAFFILAPRHPRRRPPQRDPTAPGQHPRQPTSTSRKSTALLSAHAKDADAHSLSIHTQQSSMRVSVLSRSIPTPRAARSVRGSERVPEEKDDDENEAGERPDSKLTPEMGAGALFRSLDDASSTLKGKGRANAHAGGSGSAPPSPTVASKKPPVPTRALPGSPTPSTSTLASTTTSTTTTTTPPPKRSAVSVSVSPAPRPRSAASSRSTVSTRPGSAASTSTARTTRGTGLRPPPLLNTAGGRRASGASTSASASVSEFRTALSGTSSSRSRQSSVSSVASKTTARSRKGSGASDVSVRTTGASGSGARPPVPALDPAVRRRGTPSVRSVASAAGSTSTMDTAASAARKATLAVGREKRPETKVITLKQRGRVPVGAKEKDPQKEKEKEKEKEEKEKEVEKEVEPPNTAEKERDHHKTDSTASTASASTLRVKRKGSGDTVSTVTTKATATPPTAKPTPKTAPPPVKRPAPAAPAATGTLKDLPSPRGAMLEIGIPCIITSKRKRFKAFARYIGEVEGEAGPWVGVEVPANAAGGMGASVGAAQWNDGSWGGIRYFEIGAAGSEWEYGDESRDRATRRRRLEGSAGSGGGYGYGSQHGVKREGESLGGGRGAKRIRSASPAVSDTDGAGESRGLFVRPSAVLYVVDAVGADL